MGRVSGTGVKERTRSERSERAAPLRREQPKARNHPTLPQGERYLPTPRVQFPVHAGPAVAKHLPNRFHYSDWRMTLKIVGAGLGRTGTASAKAALERLGIGRCYHMAEVLENPSHIDQWINAADGQPNWEQLLGAYGATVDYPACSFWRELSRLLSVGKGTVDRAGRWKLVQIQPRRPFSIRASRSS